MALTDEQREKRHKFVGSSDIAKIIGVDERQNAGDVWLSKTDRLPRIEATTDINRGIALEPYVLSMFEAEFGLALKRDVWVQGDDVCASNLDAAITVERKGSSIECTIADVPGVFHGYAVEAPVEAKTTNLGKMWNAETGEIPFNVLVQVSFQIYCAGPQVQHAFVPALVPTFDRFNFLSPVPIVKRNDELIEELVIAAHEFMEYVRKGQRPPDAPPHLESLKRIKREPQSIALGDEAARLWDSYTSAGEREKAVQRDREEYKRGILEVLGDAEAGRLPDGRTITFLEQNGPRHIDIDRLAVTAPRVYEELVTQSKFRVLRIKKSAVGRKAK